MKSFLIHAVMLSLVFFFTGCGDDGVNGLDGLTGKDGKAGTDGKDGVGFEEELQYGSIKLIASGTLPNNTSFKDTVNFAYMPLDDPGASYVEVGDDGKFLTFWTERMDGVILGNSAMIQLGWNVENKEVDDFSIAASFHLINADKRYFFINLSDGYHSNTQVTGYTYDAAKTSLKYTVDTVVPAANNSTGHDLKITGIVDAKVYSFYMGE